MMSVNPLRAQTCNCAQHFLDCLQSYSLFPTIDKPKRVYNYSTTLMDNIFTNTNTLPVGTLFLTSLITFPNSSSFNFLLKQLSLSKLVFKNTQNTLSRDSYGISLNYIGNLFFLGEMSISYSLLLITS